MNVALHFFEIIIFGVLLQHILKHVLSMFLSNFTKFISSSVYSKENKSLSLTAFIL